MRELRKELRTLGVVIRCDSCRAEIESGRYCQPCRKARSTVT
jgi:hypothetical protein